MAIAAFIAVIHDLLVTAGIYSLTGFQVTPDTVIAMLTILGYSLYDTVVVFDRVRENTKGFGASGRMTYEDVVNLSMNQTLARSINTSLVAILPVLAVLRHRGPAPRGHHAAVLRPGPGHRADLAGPTRRSSSPRPCWPCMKEREPRYINIRQKLANRAERTGLLTPRGRRAGHAPRRRLVQRRAARAARPSARAGCSGRAARPDRPAPPADRAGDELDGRRPPCGQRRRRRRRRRWQRPSGRRRRSGARRPPPRPRKGKGKGKGGRGAERRAGRRPVAAARRVPESAGDRAPGRAGTVRMVTVERRLRPVGAGVLDDLGGRRLLRADDAAFVAPRRRPTAS